MPWLSWQREPDLPHSLEALVAILLGLEKPPGAGWSQGWKNWSPPPLKPGVPREGVGRNWRFPTFHRGWEWEKSGGGEKAEEAHGRRNK